MKNLKRRISWGLGSVLKLALLVVSVGLLSSCASIGPLMHASKEGNIAQVNALLAKGADVNVKDSHGLTALMLASQNGHSEVVKLLLAKGADINAKANNGRTALMEASQNGHSEAVKLLKAAGAKE